MDAHVRASQGIDISSISWYITISPHLFSSLVLKAYLFKDEDDLMGRATMKESSGGDNVLGYFEQRSESGGGSGVPL